MLTQEQNDLLTRSGPGTPMGGLIRRYWVPALLSEEIPEPDCPPVHVGMLGEQLVAFRDTQGRVGLLDEHCSHRGTSLLYGRNEEAGLRCIYHGWKYDVEGRVLDTPNEPEPLAGDQIDGDAQAGAPPMGAAPRRFKDKICHPAYPTREINGIVFAYLGPAEKTPLLPNYEWASVPSSQTYVTKCLLECNYLQGLEGECDAAHTSFLHSQFGRELGGQTYTNLDRSPRYEIEVTDFGLRLAALRQAEGSRTYVRITTFVMPVSCCVAVGGVNAEGKLDGYEVHFYVPIDDHHAWRYDFGFRRTLPIGGHDLHRRLQIGPDYRRLRRPDNHYQQDRQLQRTDDFTGIEDFLNEDACATESMGSIADRSREHLGVSDVGVIALRQFLLQALEVYRAGGEPPHIVTDEANDFRHVESTAAVVEGSWREALTHVSI